MSLYQYRQEKIDKVQHIIIFELKNVLMNKVLTKMYTNHKCTYQVIFINCKATSTHNPKCHHYTPFLQP